MAQDTRPAEHFINKDEALMVIADGSGERLTMEMPCGPLTLDDALGYCNDHPDATTIKRVGILTACNDDITEHMAQAYMAERDMDNVSVNVLPEWVLESDAYYYFKKHQDHSDNSPARHGHAEYGLRGA